MNQSLKRLTTILTGAAIVGIAGIALMSAHRAEPQGLNHPSSQAPTGQSAPAANGMVILDVAAQAREGILARAVKHTSIRGELRGTAVVLSVEDLANARTTYFAAARTKLERDQANLSLLQNQYQRVKKLYEENQNMSLKALQDAESAVRDSQAQLATDRQEARLQLDVVRQKWGNAVAGWIENDSPQLDSVLEQRAFLAQATFSSDGPGTPPTTLTIELPNAERAGARFVSALPQVNPQIQSASFLYLVSGHSGIAAGMNLETRGQVGQLSRGTVVPEEAVVWWQGSAWVYEQTSPDQFVRRGVPTDISVQGGYFVPETLLSHGAKLVVTGASTLLSQELLVHPRSEGSGDEDSDED